MNTGYYRGDIFDPKHVREIKNMVRSRQDTDIYENWYRLDSEESDIILENLTYDEFDASYGNTLIPLDIADTIAANEGSVAAISYLAKRLKDLDPLQDMQGNLANWVSVLGRIVAEERRAKRRKSVPLSELQTQSQTPETYEGVNQLAHKLLRKNHVNDVIQDILCSFIQELNDAGSDILRRQMLFDKGLLIAALLKKGYNKKRNRSNK